MESSKIFGGSEECHSSESGWTMYIGSPIQGGDDDGESSTEDEGGVYAADNNGGRGNETDANRELAADSDDSMASDASSGPSHQGHLYGTVEVGLGTSCFKHGGHEDEEEGSFYLNEKATKSMEKQKLGMKKKGEKEEKEQMMTFKAKGATSTTTSRSGSKVRKSIWLGKRK